jgi:hypothetical protein
LPYFIQEKRHFMGKGFTKFKRKLGFGAVLRALVFGLSAGAVTVAVLWLLAKLTASEPDFIQYALNGAAVAAIGLLIMLLILLPTKKRIARRVDRQLALGEKTQTMLEFRKDTSAMAALQREDTDRILLETPRRRVKGVCTWLFALLPVVAALAMVGTILVPAKEPPEPPPVIENNFAITPWQTQALKDLIEKVKASDMEEEPKEATVKQLESLLIKLGSIKKEPAMKEAVISCIEGIHKAVSEHNTYDLIAEAMFKSPSKDVQDLGGAIDSLQALLIGDWMNNTQTNLTEGTVDPATIAAGITQALTLSGVDGENEVSIALLAFTVKLAAMESTDEETVAPLMTEAEEALNAALFIQATNEEVEDDTIYTLLSIFGIKASEVPEHIFNDPDDPRGEEDYEPEDDLDQIHAGGLGSGEMIFGSDDTIYDPDREAYVTYGEVIGDYYAKISELLVDGKLPAELEDALNDYFAILFKAPKDEN